MPSQRDIAHTISIVVVLAAFGVATAHAKPRDLTLYTLRVQIFKSDWTPDSMGGHGRGVANVIEGQTIRGADFVYDCTAQFAESVGNHAYMAKWKKLERTIEVLGNPVGDPNKTNTCEFKLSFHEYVYDVQGGNLTTFSLEQYRVRQGLSLPSQGAVDDDVDHYPLRLAVLKIDWSPPSNGSRSGSGRGNLQFPAGMSSVDFTAICSAPFPPNRENRYYPARWKTSGSEILLLLRGGGAAGGALTCGLKTIVHSDVYVLDASGGIKAVSQEEYRRTQPATPAKP